MKLTRVIAAVAGVTLAAGGTSVALAQGGSAPKRTTIRAVASPPKLKPNRYIQDGLRWNKDVYRVASGGTLHIVNAAAGEGPHTFTVVKKSDLPRSGAFRGCKICDKLGAAHGADPSSPDAPPKFQYLENGVGQDTAPAVDRPGDSGLTGESRGDSIDLTVTAKKGKTLFFMCLVHPWMEAKVVVG
jgi:hypothetical protein